MLQTRFKNKFNLYVLGLVVLIFIVIAYQGINMDYKVEDGYIKISWFTGENIPINDITEFRILDKAPNMSRIIGVDLFSIKQGVYTLEGIGRVKMYASDINRKIVLITTNSMTYGLTPENAEQFVKMVKTN